MFKNTNDNKRYYTLNYYYQNRYHKKISKITFNAFSNCPNKPRCIYCKEGSKYFNTDINIPLKEQYDTQIKKIAQKWPSTKYIGYFQTNTNTYAPLNELKSKYEEVLSFPDIIGLNIATRSDAISDEVFNYLIDLNNRTDLTIELGLQSIHEKSLKLIRRGHDLKNFENMVNRLQKENIKVVVHIINGIPNETKNDMIETVKYLNKLNIHGIKIHMLHIIKDTDLEQYYYQTNFHVLNLEEYVDIVISQLEYLNENIVIHRITGDPNKNDLIEPRWLIKKFVVLNEIDKEMLKRNAYQSKKIKA